MPEGLNGKSIVVSTTKNLNTTEIARVIEDVYAATSCRGCTSGGYFLLRQEVELPLESEFAVRAVISAQE